MVGYVCFTGALFPEWIYAYVLNKNKINRTPNIQVVDPWESWDPNFRISALTFSDIKI